MCEYKSKWNRYKIGKVPWIEANRYHAHRDRFVLWVRNREVKSILEVGGGELIEAKRLKEKDYTICDISDVFRGYAEDCGFKTINYSMNELEVEKKYDVIYAASVLEHSPDIIETIKRFSKASKYFYFTMFKWLTKGGGLKSRFDGNFYSTEFDINKLIDLIKRYGIIEDLTLTSPAGHITDFLSYEHKGGLHRNKTYLSIIGKWREKGDSI